MESMYVLLDSRDAMLLNRDTSGCGNVLVPDDHLESGTGCARRGFPCITLTGGANERTSGASEGLSPPF